MLPAAVSTRIDSQAQRPLAIVVVGGMLMMLMTNNRQIMGAQVNSRALNGLGWITTGAIFAASDGAT